MFLTPLFTPYLTLEASPFHKEKDSTYVAIRRQETDDVGGAI
jgi:hypothetical protein